MRFRFGSLRKILIFLLILTLAPVSHLVPGIHAEELPETTPAAASFFDATGINKGEYVNFGGKVWYVLDPSTNYLFLHENDGHRKYSQHPIGTGSTWKYDPVDPESIAHYLNNDFYSTLENKDWVVTTDWLVNGSYIPPVPAKIGLISANDYRTSGLPNLGYSWYTFTPIGRNPGTDNISVVDPTGNVVINSTDVDLGIHPVLHLKSGLGKSGGTGTLDDPYVLFEIPSNDPNNPGNGVLENVTITVDANRNVSIDGIDGNNPAWKYTAEIQDDAGNVLATSPLQDTQEDLAEWLKDHFSPNSTYQVNIGVQNGSDDASKVGKLVTVSTPAIPGGSHFDEAGIHKGEYVSFGGKVWFVLDPSTNYLLLYENDGNKKYNTLPVIEQHAHTHEYDPDSPESIASYLNHEFYNSLPDKEWVVTTDWVVRSNLPAVTAKIGLISSSDYESSGLPSLGHDWFTFTPTGLRPMPDRIVYVDSSGALQTGSTDSEMGIHPVLHVKSGIGKARGAGTLSDPYSLYEIPTIDPNNPTSETIANVTVTVDRDGTVVIGGINGSNPDWKYSGEIRDSTGNVLVTSSLFNSPEELAAWLKDRLLSNGTYQVIIGIQNGTDEATRVEKLVTVRVEIPSTDPNNPGNEVLENLSITVDANRNVSIDGVEGNNPAWKYSAVVQDDDGNVLATSPLQDTQEELEGWLKDHFSPSSTYQVVIGIQNGTDEATIVEKLVVVRTPAPPVTPTPTPTPAPTPVPSGPTIPTRDTIKDAEITIDSKGKIEIGGIHEPDDSWTYGAELTDQKGTIIGTSPIFEKITDLEQWIEEEVEPNSEYTLTIGVQVGDQNATRVDKEIHVTIPPERATSSNVVVSNTSGGVTIDLSEVGNPEDTDYRVTIGEKVIQSSDPVIQVEDVKWEKEQSVIVEAKLPNGNYSKIGTIHYASFNSGPLKGAKINVRYDGKVTITGIKKVTKGLKYGVELKESGRKSISSPYVSTVEQLAKWIEKQLIMNSKYTAKILIVNDDEDELYINRLTFETPLEKVTLQNVGIEESEETITLDLADSRNRAETKYRVKVGSKRFESEGTSVVINKEQMRSSVLYVEAKGSNGKYSSIGKIDLTEYRFQQEAEGVFNDKIEYKLLMDHDQPRLEVWLKDETDLYIRAVVGRKSKLLKDQPVQFDGLDSTKTYTLTISASKGRYRLSKAYEIEFEKTDDEQKE